MPLRPLRGITILELCLALGIATILAAIAIPAAQGWISERQLRQQLDHILDQVYSARQQALTSGKSRTLHFADPKAADELRKRGINPILLAPEFQLLRKQRDERWIPANPLTLTIQPGGVLSPITLRLQQNSRYITFTFHPLSGDYEELEFSF